MKVTSINQSNQKQTFCMLPITKYAKISKTAKKIANGCDELVRLTEKSGEIDDINGTDAFWLREKFASVLKVLDEKAKLKIEADEKKTAKDFLEAAFG